jgi:Polyketide cyclase / dehydrase and lipid transport
MQRSITRSISIDAPPDAVLDLVADPPALPRWAPAFARAVRPAGGDQWLVDKGGRELRIRVRVARELGTVDFLAADAPPGVEIGVFTRVVRNAGGSELVLTRFFPDSMSEIEVAEQKAVVAVELQTVRALCESAPSRAAAA